MDRSNLSADYPVTPGPLPRLQLGSADDNLSLGIKLPRTSHLPIGIPIVSDVLLWEQEVRFLTPGFRLVVHSQSISDRRTGA